MNTIANAVTSTLQDLRNSTAKSAVQHRQRSSGWFGKLNEWMRWLAVSVLKHGPIPKHVAFIMDGNRRFARKINQDVRIGHWLGHIKLQETLEWCLELGVETITVFAFSIENFKRPKEEVDALMELAYSKFEEMLNDSDILSKHRRIKVLGDITRLPSKLQQVMGKVQYESHLNKRSTLNICVSYTSTEEITHAINTLVNGVHDEKIDLNDITEELFQECLYSHHCIEPDMVVRTSGEVRLSDFLLWQSAFSSFAFYQVYWPEFSAWNLYQTVLMYQRNYNEMQKRKEEYQSRFPSAPMSTKAIQFVELLREEELKKLEEYAAEYDQREKTTERNEEKLFYSKLRVDQVS